MGFLLPEGNQKRWKILKYPIKETGTLDIIKNEKSLKTISIKSFKGDMELEDEEGTTVIKKFNIILETEEYLDSLDMNQEYKLVIKNLKRPKSTKDLKIIINPLLLYYSNDDKFILKGYKGYQGRQGLISFMSVEEI